MSESETTEQVAGTPLPGAEAGAGAGAAADNGTDLGPQKGFWKTKAALLPNKDAYVAIKQLLFDKQTTPMQVRAVEPVTEDGGLSVRLAFFHEKELESFDDTPVKKAPGVWRPRFPYVIQAGADATPDQEERGLRELGSILQAAGVVPADKVPTAEDVVAGLDELQGKRVQARFVCQTSKKKDPETGKMLVYQNVYFSKVREGAEAGAEEGKKKMFDY